MAYISVGSHPSPILEFLEEWSMENLDEIAPSAITEYVFYSVLCGVIIVVYAILVTRITGLITVHVFILLQRYQDICKWLLGWHTQGS